VHPPQAWVRPNGRRQGGGFGVRNAVEDIRAAQQVLERSLLAACAPESRIAFVVAREPLRRQQRIVHQQFHRRVDIGHQVPQVRLQWGGKRDLDR
jgi:hypothetical protein